MKDLVLVQPPLSKEDRYGVLSAGGSSLPPFGLAWLAAVARDRGASVAVIDAEAESLGPGATAERILSLAGPLVGFTATTISVGRAAAVARLLRDRGYAGAVVIGGAHVTACPEGTLERNPVFDLAVLGEGEATLVDLLELTGSARWKDDGQALSAVQGIAWRRPDGEVLVNRRRPFLDRAELASLPLPAFDLLPPMNEAYQPSALRTHRLPSSSLVTTRGCAGKCSFCDNSVFGRRVRAFPAEYVLEMVSKLVADYGIRDLTIYDDNFVVNRKRLYEFCKGLGARRLDLSWSCNARVDVIDGDLVEMVKAAGCWQMSVGIESGVQEILDREYKGITLEQVRRAVGLLCRAGIRTKGFFMIGHPGESRATVERTIDFALELPLDDFQMSFLTPFPGTCLHAGISEWGELDENWDDMNMWTPVFVPRGMSREELVELQQRAMRSFYFRPRIVWRYLCECIRNPAAAGAVMRGGLALLKSLLSKDR